MFRFYHFSRRLSHPCNLRAVTINLQTGLPSYLWEYHLSPACRTCHDRPLCRELLVALAPITVQNNASVNTYTHIHTTKKSNRTNNNAIRNKQRTTKKFQKTNCCCGSRDKRCYYCCYGNRVLPLVNSATGTMRTVTYFIFIIFFHGVWNMASVTMVTSRARNHNIPCKPCT